MQIDQSIKSLAWSLNKKKKIEFQQERFRLEKRKSFLPMKVVMYLEGSSTEVLRALYSGDLEKKKR